MFLHVALLAFVFLVNGREINHNKAAADSLSTESTASAESAESTESTASSESTEKGEAEQIQTPFPAQGTAPNLIAQVLPTVATKGVEKEITLKGSGEGTFVGGKAVFIPVASGCKQSTPTVLIPEGGNAKFKITGEVGNYKLCFQAPGKNDSVEQVSQGPDLTLNLVAPTTTGPAAVTGIFPTVITVNVRTMIDFEGAGPGDKATWVNAATNDCSAVSPDKDVGVGHNLFVVSSSGDYQLCYRVYGATDSVAQENITLKVRAPGVNKDMTERWKRFIKKEGQIDCDTLTWVPNCAMSNKSYCEKSYAIDSAVGYRCSWDDSVFPPYCTMDLTTSDADKICKELTCGGDPTPRCWE